MQVDRNDRFCIIGAGPAGLAAGAALQARGLAFDIVDAGPGVGGIWDIDRDRTPMYQTAHFISSRTLSGFPGFPMPADYPDYPRHDRILEYIRAFARHHDLEPHVTSGVRVEEVQPEAAAAWSLRLSTGETRLYRGVCVATGAAWHPHLPDVPGRFAGDAYHSFHYRSPEELRGRRVLVVGAGNSGCELACDAARVADRALLSLRRGYWFIPKYIMGKPADVFAHGGLRLPAWLERPVFEFLIGRLLVGDLTRYGLPRPDHRILESHPIMNTQVLHHLGHGDLEVRPDVAELKGGAVVFADGREDEVDLILWATGYERRFPFLDEEDLDRRDDALDLYLNVFHRRHPELVFLGLFETDGAAFGLLGKQAALVAAWWAALARGDARAEAFDRHRREDRPDLRGGQRYLASRRHRYYVKSDAYQRILDRARRVLEPAGGPGRAPGVGPDGVSVADAAVPADRVGPRPGSVRSSTR